MKQTKKISIIIPVYNGEQFLCRCIDSIINQTYKNYEIIIINDGSTDRTKQIIEKYVECESRIIFIDKINSGVSDSRNIGIDNASGDYITFIDADDWLEKDTLETMNKLLEKNEYDVIRYNYYTNYSNEVQEKSEYDIEIKDQKLEKEKIEKIMLPQILTGQMPAYVWLLLIKKRVINKTKKFNTELAMMEDTIFYVNLLTNIDNIYICSKNLYHYYYDMNSASHSFKNAIRNLHNILLVHNLEIKLICEKKLDIEKNIKLCNVAHAKMIEDISFRIFKNYSFEESKEKIDEICNNEEVHNIFSNADFNKIQIHKKIAMKMIMERKINLLMLFYRIRKIFYYLKNYFTKRIIN